MKRFINWTLCLVALAFSAWLMWHTLSYAPGSGHILVGSKYWSDFGGHLPQIRSFSQGFNWPPEYPLYPGEPIRYHFLFYYLVGLLEKAGLRIDWALNLPSALGFFSLLLMIFALAKRVFSKTSVALLSVVFFLFNASLSWHDYLKGNSLILKSSIINLKSLSQFPSFAPWRGSDITAFWNLNIYTNQRHLALSFAVALAVVYLLYSRKHLFLIGFLTGFLLLINQAAFLAAGLFILSFFIFHPSLRPSLFLSSLGALPWLYYSKEFVHVSPLIVFRPGFLLSGPLDAMSLAVYWFRNIGPHLLLIPLGFILAPRRAKILVLPLLALFVVPNLFQLSVDMINNHKFFNFFLIAGSMFSAYVLVRLRPLIILLPLLVLGGVVDFFPVKNDSFLALPDIPANPDARYFQAQTLPSAIVLNSTWFYHPASIAGRKVFNGYPYFTWSFGYDQVARERQTMAIYQAPDSLTACRLLSQFKISHVELNDRPESFIAPNRYLWGGAFPPEYYNPQSGTAVYNVSKLCPAT